MMYTMYALYDGDEDEGAGSTNQGCVVQVCGV